MKKYKSKFGFEILILITIIWGAIIMFMVFENEPLEAMLSVSGIFLLVYGLCLYLSFSTEYTIFETGILTIRSGVFYNKEFDIDKIKSIAKTNNFVSSPAPSFDRIELTYKKFDVIIISPKDKIGFAQELKKINPRIENKLSL